MPTPRKTTAALEGRSRAKGESRQRQNAALPASRRQSTRLGDNGLQQRESVRASRRPADAGRRPESADRARSGANRSASAASRSGARATIARWRRYGIAAFAVVMVLGTLVGLAFFARPTTSDFEKRTLTTYPEFTVSSFLDGSYFTQVSLWYADTYPLREPLVRASKALEGHYGIQPKTQLVGGNVQADVVPPADNASAAASPAQAPETRNQVDPPDAQVMQADIQANVMNGLYVDGDRACSMYYFNQSAVDTYCAALNACAEALDGQATVYSVLIPNNSGALLDESVLAGLGGSDQKQSLDYFHSKMSEKIRVVETYDALREHRDEYIYFRTDHHWTQLGAYYAYKQLCEKRGVEPANIEAWEQDDYSPFLGTFYAELGLESMAANPDSVHVYIPSSTNEMTYWDEAGAEYETNVILDADESGYAENGKYLCFIAGDQPLSVIRNPKRDDGSACVLVKDSYGCAFAPLLVDDYQTVWIIDFREYTESIPQFVRENGVQDVIFLNNMTIAGTESVGEGLMGIVQ